MRRFGSAGATFRLSTRRDAPTKLRTPDPGPSDSIHRCDVGSFTCRCVVISLIFATLAIPPHLQHRVLFYGILGVIVLRAIMIGLGAALVSQFAWVLFIFGAFLIATGVKLLIVADKPSARVDNRMMRVLHRRMRVTKELHGGAFFAQLPNPAGGRPLLYATPLFVGLALIEFAHAGARGRTSHDEAHGSLTERTGG